MTPRSSFGFIPLHLSVIWEREKEIPNWFGAMGEKQASLCPHHSLLITLRLQRGSGREHSAKSLVKSLIAFPHPFSKEELGFYGGLEQNLPSVSHGICAGFGFFSSFLVNPLFFKACLLTSLAHSSQGTILSSSPRPKYLQQRGLTQGLQGQRVGEPQHWNHACWCSKEIRPPLFVRIIFWDK